jgi:protein-tyrosine-phosphatase
MARSIVLLLCTGNSRHSQMAEVLVNHLLEDTWEAFSAATNPSGCVPVPAHFCHHATRDHTRSRPPTDSRHK